MKPAKPERAVLRITRPSIPERISVAIREAVAVVVPRSGPRWRNAVAAIGSQAFSSIDTSTVSIAGLRSRKKAASSPANASIVRAADERAST